MKREEKFENKICWNFNFSIFKKFKQHSININAFSSYSPKTKRDGQMDGRMGGVAISPVPGHTAPAGDKNA